MKKHSSYSMDAAVGGDGLEAVATAAANDSRVRQMMFFFIFHFLLFTQ
jgi:hypothetical protein